MWLLWDWMGIDHWEFHGMALWAMHWDPMDLHWGCSLRIPWQCSMGRSLGCPHGTPMELHCYCSIGAAWKCLMCNTFGHPPMWLLWAWMGIDPWACHGMALWVVHWDPMDLHKGCSLRIPWKCFMGRSLGCPHGPPWNCSGNVP